MKLSKKMKVLLVIATIVLVSTVSLTTFFVKQNKYQEISYTEFMTNVKKGNIKNVNLSDDSKITGVTKDGKNFKTDNPRSEDFKKQLLESKVKVEETNGTSFVTNTFFLVMTLIGFVGIIHFSSKNSSKQAQKEMTQMSSIGNDNDVSTKITFDDVAGNEEAKENLRELVDFIQNPEKYQKYGARMPRGVLLYGAPGTGKTLLAKALAGEAGVPFFAVTGSDFIQIYAGVGASRIRSLFKKAREAGKCVIFIDEIDAMGKKRKSGLASGASDESDRTLNALLTEMSGFKGNEGIIVIGATNRIDTLDDALLRPGRFDRQIEVGLPDVNARYKILKLHSKNKPISQDVDLKKVAYQTVYFSGAKLESLMNESAMIAAKHNDLNITMNHIDKAFYTVVVGEEKKDRSSISLEEKSITAYHEAGHALVAKLTCPKNRVTKVSIIPSTKGAGGFSMNIPPDKMYQTKDDIKNHIMISLGGRAAEEIVFGKDNITTGASNDLERSTNMALSMISKFGMDDEAGLINYEIALGGNLGANNYIIDRTRFILKEMYDKTLDILKNNMNLLEKITQNLLEKETLDEDEINNILEN
ncbi:ATP-dependent zinc metalloprotease FtsH 1 [Gottschalkia purinilytica]|uniref:ATP-dependent zinc metalloprotease FtsH n=1 Tax=Gottschalkia purinilytica TaxID=1503 RepID=A0A0L0WDF0_GOTPU|nr:ATP-dependent zinc metalloprotease FtsH 1 [Gottschalkia purinilytica]